MTFPKRTAALIFLALLAASPVTAQPGQATWLDRLHDALRLRPDQDQAWARFQQASAMDPQDDSRQRDAYERMARLRAPQRMDLSIELMRSDLDGMERRRDALKDFYGALSPDQQAIFDRETLRPPE
jgi:hypothetical protein